MFRKISIFLAISSLGTACLTGNSYPDQYASAYCQSLFTCVPENQIDLATSYDSIEECELDFAESIRSGADFDAFQEGDAEFKKVKAESCINEVEQMLTDDSCDGDQDILSFTLDATESDCNEVYD